jgi:ethanolamine utilization protein EutN
VTLCKVIGDVVATVKHPDFDGQTLLICQPIDEKGRAVGDHILAVDRAQAGPGDTVLVLREGSGIRQIFQRKIFSVRSIVIGIVDAVDVGFDFDGAEAV